MRPPAETIYQYRAAALALLTTVCLLLISPGPQQWASAAGLTVTGQTDNLRVYGRIVNPHGRGVNEAEVEVKAGGTPLAAAQPARGGEAAGSLLETETDGSFQAEFAVPAGTAKHTAVTIRVAKTGYAPEYITLTPAQLGRVGNTYLADIEVTMQRTLGPACWIAAVVFVLVYLLISFELLHRTLAAMLGASCLLVISYTLGSLDPEYRILSFASAIRSLDMNVILLLLGMMMLVGILKQTGIFHWCAYQCYQLARGNVTVLSGILMIFTAAASAFLDNVTTMLLLTPISIDIALSLGISPLALLIPEILASNIGGTATLIGDPPNIMVGSFAGLTFMDFVRNLIPVCTASMVLLLVYATAIFRQEYARAKVDEVPAMLAQLQKEHRITDRTLLTVGIIIMSTVIGLFLTHGFLHMPVSIAAIFGASLLCSYGLLTNRIRLLELLEKDIEWSTLLFFMFLFILVGAVEETGLLDLIADRVLHLSHGNLTTSICLIVWVAAIMSAFIDNIPFTATMLPIVDYLTRVTPGAEGSNVLWWALALGACFGGNGTLIGASANVVTLGMAESAGHSITFINYLKIGLPYMLLSVGLANVWLLIFY